MYILIKWGIRAYLLITIVKTASEARGRTLPENLRAVNQSLATTKAAFVALNNIRSTGAYLNPAKEQSIRDGRAQAPSAVRSATTAILGSAGTDVLRIDDYWNVRTDEDGNLIAAGDNGEHAPLANRAPADDGTDMTADDGKGKKK